MSNILPNPTPQFAPLAGVAPPWAGGRMVNVTFRVRVAEITPPDETIYLVGNHNLFGPWNPSLCPLFNRGGGVWEATILIPDGTELEYKYTRGSWDQVEWWGRINGSSNRRVAVNFGMNGYQFVDDTGINPGLPDEHRAVQCWRDPLVASTTPADNFLGVAPFMIAIAFNREIQPYSSDFSTSVVVKKDGLIVAGTVTLFNGKMLIWTPTVPLDEGDYSVSVFNVKSDLGQDSVPLLRPHQLTFTVTLEESVEHRYEPQNIMAVERRERRNTVILAALGAGFSYLFLLAAETMKEWDVQRRIDFILVTALMILVSIKLADPLIEQMRRTFGLGTHPHIKHGRRRLIGTLIALSSTILLELFHGVLTEGNVLVALITLGVALLSVGSITYWWVCGARRHPSRAALYGGLGGAIFGITFMMLWLAGVGAFAVTSPAAILELMAINGAGWGMGGFAGGLAIDKGWGPRPSVSVALSIVGAWLLFDFFLIVIGLMPSTADMIPDLVRAGGWGIALMLYTPSNRVLDKRRALQAQPLPYPAR